MASPIPAVPAGSEPIHVPIWAWMLVAFAAVAVYLIALDNSLLGHLAEQSHEFFHDARHFIGMPCH